VRGSGAGQTGHRERGELQGDDRFSSEVHGTSPLRGTGTFAVTFRGSRSVVIALVT
jgi:hypothetical protein